MISIVSVKKGVINKIEPLAEELKVKITSNEIRSGFDKPAFFIRMIPISTSSDLTRAISTMMINIEYFPEEKTELKLLEMIDSLNYIFSDGMLELEKEMLTIEEITPEIVENVLLYKIIVRPYEIFTSDDTDYEIMEDLQLDIDI